MQDNLAFMKKYEMQSRVFTDAKAERFLSLSLSVLQKRRKILRRIS